MQSRLSWPEADTPSAKSEQEGSQSQIHETSVPCASFINLLRTYIYLSIFSQTLTFPSVILYSIASYILHRVHAETTGLWCMRNSYFPNHTQPHLTAMFEQDWPSCWIPWHCGKRNDPPSVAFPFCLCCSELLGPSFKGRVPLQSHIILLES